jgi:hypothetical protein
MEKEKRNKIKEEFLNLILGRKYGRGIRHFQTAQFITVSGCP